MMGRRKRKAADAEVTGTLAAVAKTSKTASDKVAKIKVEGGVSVKTEVDETSDSPRLRRSARSKMKVESAPSKTANVKDKAVSVPALNKISDKDQVSALLALEFSHNVCNTAVVKQEEQLVTVSSPATRDKKLQSSQVKKEVIPKRETFDQTEMDYLDNREFQDLRNIVSVAKNEDRRETKKENEDKSVFLELLSELEKEKDMRLMRRRKMMRPAQMPRLVPIRGPQHKTFSGWLKDCSRKAAGCVIGMEVETANNKPDDMDMDSWILIQQFQNSLESSVFDYNLSTITPAVNQERARTRVLVDLGHKMVRTSRFFVCQGCNYAAETRTRLQLHLERQEKSLLVYKCLRCHYRNVSRCAMSIHVKSHKYDPKYMAMPVEPDAGLYCPKCRFNVRYKKLGPHHEIHHDRVFQTNFNSDFITDWREWFTGK